MALTTDNVRTDIATKLTGTTAAGSNVFDSRQTPIFKAQLPALVVLDGGCRDELRSASVPMFRRTQTVIIDGYATGDTDAEAGSAVATVLEQARAALYGNTNWIGAFETFASVTGPMTFSSAGDQADVRVAGQRLTVEIEWNAEYTRSFDDDFETLDIDVEGGPDGTDGDEVHVDVLITLPTL